MDDVPGDTWAVFDRDADGRFPVAALLKAVHEATDDRNGWFLWVAEGGTDAHQVLAGHDPVRDGLLQVDPEAIMAGAEGQWFDWLLLRDSSQLIEFGVFDSSFMFVRAVDGVVAPIVAAFRDARRLAPSPSPITRIWRRSAESHREAT